MPRSARSGADSALATFGPGSDVPIAIPLLLFGAAFSLAKQGSAGGDVIDDPDDTSGAPPPDSMSNPQYASRLEELRGDVPMEVLQRWIARESGGDPCSVGSTAQLLRDGYAREAGLFQVYFESAADSQFGVLSRDLRAACSQVSQQRMRDLTADELDEQLMSGIKMATAFRAIADSQLSSSGITWTEPECWALAKLYHCLPAIGKSFLPAAARAGQADSWSAFSGYCNSLSGDDAAGIDKGAAPYWGSVAKLFENASFVGGVQ